MCAYHNPEPQSHYPIDHDPDRMSILAKREKDHDLNDSFGNQNYAHDQGEKNNSKQRIYEQIDCSDAVERGYERMPAPMDRFEMNTEDEMSNGRKNKKPT